MMDYPPTPDPTKPFLIEWRGITMTRHGETSRDEHGTLYFSVLITNLIISSEAHGAPVVACSEKHWEESFRFMLEDSMNGLVSLLVQEELRSAEKAFPLGFKNQHEAIAVIREEYLELEREVFLKQSEYDIARQRKEAVQLAAMCMRFIKELA